MMPSPTQKARAVQFRDMHSGSPILVLGNAWDAASARIFEQAGFRAVATTSSGVAAALGYRDGQHIRRDMLIEVVRHITRVVSCPVTVDIESGYGESIEEVLQTIKAIIEAGAVGINIEDSTKGSEKKLLDISYQVELLQAISALSASMDVPLVINARTDVYLLPSDESPATRLEEAVRRGNAYLQAGADCFFPITVSDAQTIGSLTREISGPINILAGPNTPTIPELAQLGVARVSFGSGQMRAVLGRLRNIARELLEQGTYVSMAGEMLTGSELHALF
ncbi:MAG TPA: isocitrate lyase/phosphoenolpyruvate mutase family protein [Ktedonobacteraceae bacterium]|nr:isocitrate lyase/phosphoenolpyruvate mutase family protein [Ktedonobacteraceae bacterium]